MRAHTHTYLEPRIPTYWPLLWYFPTLLTWNFAFPLKSSHILFLSLLFSLYKNLRSRESSLLHNRCVKAAWSPEAILEQTDVLFTEAGSILNGSSCSLHERRPNTPVGHKTCEKSVMSQIFHCVFCLSSSSELGAGGPPVGTRPVEDEAGRHVAGCSGPDLRPGPALDSLRQRYEYVLSGTTVGCKSN